MPLEAIQRTLAGVPEARLQCVEQQSTALARIGGGGVELLLLGAEAFAAVQAAAPEIPKIVLWRSGEERMARSASRQGAAAVACDQIEAALPAAVEAALGKSGGGAILGFVGVKGGVGATSVALNVAAALARKGSVALWEFQPAGGSLAGYLHGPAARPGSVPYRRIPGLSVRFASPEEPVEQAPAILRELARANDYVVVDMCRTHLQAHAARMQPFSALTLVLERDPVCLPLAARLLQELESLGPRPRRAGLVVVNRSALSSPFPLPDVEKELGMPPWAVIAPAPDLFLAAARAQQPVVAFQPDSIAAGNLMALAEHLARRPGCGDVSRVGISG